MSEVQFEQGAVEEFLEAAHAIGDHLLAVLDQACRELDVAYFLTSGTLLGAVRNGSWIPWDDDVDVIMFRADYERLAAGIAGHLPGNVVFTSAETRPDHITTIPRLLYLDSHRVHVGRSRSNVPVETLHVPLDIFVLDRGPRRLRLRLAWSRAALALEKVASARYTSVRDVVAEPGIGPARKAVELLGVLLSRVRSHRGWHDLRTWWVTYPARRGWTGPYVAFNYSTPRGRRMGFEEEWYLPAGGVEFSGEPYPAPGDPAAVLTELYGPSYLTPPEAAERQPIHLRGGLEATLGERHWRIGAAVEGEPLPVQPLVQPPVLETRHVLDPVDAPEVPLAPEDQVLPPLAEGVTARTTVSFKTQVLWALSARLVAAVLQIMVLILLARGLHPSRFAVVSTVNVVLQVTVAVNGFGLLRQIEYRRSRNRDDPDLGSLFALRLRFSYASAVLWVIACLAIFALTREVLLLELLPAAIWLMVEQTTQVWNGVSQMDGTTKNLMASYLTRRAPVVGFLAAALALGLPIVWAWTLGLAAGSFLSYAQGVRGQEPWARVLVPRSSLIHVKMPFELGYWWGQVGLQLRDMDVAAVSAVSSMTAGFYAFPARLIAPMNLVTVSTASSAFPRVARAGGLTRRHLQLGVTVGLLPVTVIAIVTAACAPLLPVILGHAYDDSVAVLRIACVTAVFSGATILIGIMLQAHSTEAARAVGYLALGFAVAQVAFAGLGAYLGGAVMAAAFVAVVNGLMAVTIYLQAARRAMA